MIQEEPSVENYTAASTDQQGDLEQSTVDQNAADLGAEAVNQPDIGKAEETEIAVKQPVAEAEAVEAPAEEDLEQALAQLAEEAESLRSQYDERTNQYVRLVADFDNFRKRTQKEKEDLEQQVKRSTLGELLPVIDSFERARSQLKPQSEAEANVHMSYQGIYKQLVDCLKRIGVAPMRSEGKPFDPNLHEAVMREQTDEHPEGTVIEEMVRGYLLGDLVLRHALVKVAAAPEAVVISEENSSE
ncbi:MAG: nucleotide exchange factor GrpE [Aphanocapsa sp. GSE-SYN-MK-11-07L]|jgi:molecular chaperone GrpE|nr:nucleotide exchange factor GrpE [Aphanocapsa sp. GSE-SYN-MK-11-07L]